MWSTLTWKGHLVVSLRHRPGRTGATTFTTIDAFTHRLTGLTPQDVVKINVFLTDMDDFEEMNRVYASRFVEPFPARTTIGVASLPLGSNIEIDLIAQRR